MTSRRARWGTIGLLCIALLVTGCSAAEPGPAGDPRPVGQALPAVDTTQMRLPTPFEGLQVVTPEWEITPHYADGVYLAAGEHDGVLEFTAVDLTGEALWSAQRPLSCSGFALTTDAQGRALAILTDVNTTDEALAGTSASAYDLSTGEQVWGPVEVPGPYQGPGLVFAAPPEEFVGESGPRTALDPTTGQIAATESGADPERIVGEYHGTLLLEDGQHLIARDIARSRELWRVPLADHGWDPGSIRPTLDPISDEERVLIEVSATSQALLDLRDGTVLSEALREAAVDASTDTRVILDDDGLHAYDSDDQLLWSLSTSAETSIAAVGGVFLYLREDQAVRVHNVITGEVAEAYDPHGQGPIIVPIHITANGTALLSDGQRYLMATIDTLPTTDPVP